MQKYFSIKMMEYRLLHVGFHRIRTAMITHSYEGLLSDCCKYVPYRDSVNIVFRNFSHRSCSTPIKGNNGSANFIQKHKKCGGYLFALSSNRFSSKWSKTTSQRHFLDKRYIFVHTSVERWMEVDAVRFDVGYLDSLNTEENVNKSSQRVPTVAAIHDVHGSYADLVKVVEPFVKLGCRVVVPAMPGTADTRGEKRIDDIVFLHSAIEKAEFIVDFLLTLGIEKVDLLIAAGANAHPAVLLCARQPAMFRSLGLISPWGVRLCRGMKPLAYYNWFQDSLEYRITKPLTFIAHWAQAAVGRSTLSYQQALAVVRNVTGINFPEFGGNCAILAKKQHPCFVICTDSDKYVEEEVSSEVMTLLSIPQSSVTVHDRDTVTKQGVAVGKRSGLILKGQDTDYLQTDSDLISAYLIQLLRSVKYIPGQQ